MPFIKGGGGHGLGSNFFNKERMRRQQKSFTDSGSTNVCRTINNNCKMQNSTASETLNNFRDFGQF